MPVPPRMLGDAPVHPVLATKDKNKMQMFYQEQLGLRVKEERDEEVILKSGNTELLIFQHPDAKPSGRTVIGWEVDNPRQTLKDLAARGVKVQHYNDGPYKTDADGIISMDGMEGGWFKDIDGNFCAVFNKK